MYSLEGTVIALEAPIFREEDDTTKVVDYLRVGEKVHILDLESELQNDSLFYTIFDKRKRKAYIEKSFVEVEYNDSRDNYLTKLSFDPTDYRVKEPLPKNYPFKQKEMTHKGSISIGSGKPQGNFYPVGNIKNSTSNRSLNFDVTWLKILKERFFLGGSFFVENYQNSYVVDKKTYYENSRRLSVGPTLSYVLLKDEAYNINLSGSVFLNLIYEKNISFKNETYNSKFFSPRASVEWEKFIKNSPIRFIIGGDLLIDPRHKMKASSDNYIEESNLNFILKFGLVSTY